MAETDFLYKELLIKFEKANLDATHNYKDWQAEKSNLEELIQKYEDEKKQNKELYAYEMHLKMNELKNLNDKLKEEHRRELEHVNAEYDKSLKDLKAIYESVTRNKIHQKGLILFCRRGNYWNLGLRKLLIFSKRRKRRVKIKR